METIIAAVLYSATWLALAWHVKRRSQAPKVLIFALMLAALLTHGLSTYVHIVTPDGYQFGLFKIAPLFFWVVNILVLASSVRKPLHNLYLLLLQVTILALLADFTMSTPTATPSTMSGDVLLHVCLSVLAFSTMIMATVQALALAYQNHQLRSKHPIGLIRLLPPLQTMEALLFELLWVGQILLTAALATGVLFVEDLKPQIHKTVFSVLAWIIYAILLWGRHQLGWRGNSAIRWTLSGFALLVVAYFGSKLVLELILGRG